MRLLSVYWDKTGWPARSVPLVAFLRVDDKLCRGVPAQRYDSGDAEFCSKAFQPGMRRCVLILLSMFLSVGSRAANASACQPAISNFLAAPAEGTLAALIKANEAICWAKIKSSNRDLEQLNRWVAHGNPWAAQYSAKHIRQLDGGDLEDAFLALGSFSDHDIERLLLFAKEGLLSQRELSDALTRLPLAWRHKPRVQLACVELRKSRIARVTRADLAQQRAQAIRAIDEFETEIKSKH